MQADSTKAGQKGRFYLTKHIWVPQEPIENFNLKMSDLILSHMPKLPLGGAEAMEAYPILNELRKDHDKIKADLQYVLGHREEIPTLNDVHPRDLFVPGRGWLTFMLKIWGHEIKANIAAVPDTYAAICRIPGVHSALFSILAPGAEIVPHRGPAAGVVPLPLSADRAQGTGEVLDRDRRPPLLLGGRRAAGVRRHARALGQEPDQGNARRADRRL